MEVKVKNEGIVLKSRDIEFEKGGVFNPACIEVGGIIHMFYRAVDSYKRSSIGYCQLKNNEVIFRPEKPILLPDDEYERMGLEDPRITYLDGIYYLFYTVFDGENALVSYATAKKLPHFTQHGVISPQITYEKAGQILKKSNLLMKYKAFEEYYQFYLGDNVLLWEKDAFLFPKKFNNKFALIHRILPGVQLIYFEKFSDLTVEFWDKYLKDLLDDIILEPNFWYESRNVGGGCPPIPTEAGWLLIYHAVEDSSRGKIYHASAALLDKKNPRRIIGRLKEPLFSPKSPWEREGVTNNVVFPTGAIVRNERLYIYYGAADKLIALKSVNLDNLINAIKLSI